jgi:hypothetical protein
MRRNLGDLVWPAIVKAIPGRDRKSMRRSCRGTREESDALIVPMKRSNKPVMNGGGERGGKGRGRREGKRQRMSRTRCRNGMSPMSLACGSELHGPHSPDSRSRPTFGRSPVRESRTPGSARGAMRNHRRYRDNRPNTRFSRGFASRLAYPVADFRQRTPSMVRSVGLASPAETGKPATGYWSAPRK